MGKKNKKLKKKKSAISTPVQQNQLKTAALADIEEPEIALADKAVETQAKQVLAPEFAYVSRDVKKILTILGIIVLILIGLYFLDIKTSYLASMADWIYRILNIQAH